MVKDLSRLVDENGIYAAVAVDQRGALLGKLNIPVPFYYDYQYEGETS
ncbi:hypothetical protein QS428_06895 [Staphylococcus pseudintermedius]|nr:hypothetical protein QS428_06895 [Staphylococcus pseudintermedius]